MRYPGLVLLILFASLAAQAQTYKWVDAKGQTQYSDQPPPGGVKFEKISTAPPAAGSSAPAAAPGKSLSESELEFRKRQLESDEKQLAEDKKAKDKQEACDSATSRFNLLRNGGRIIKSNVNGEREYLGDDEIASELVKAQKKLDETCK